MDDQLSPEESEQLRGYREAFEQEFSEGLENAATAKTVAITDIEGMKADALTTLQRIVKYSDNEGLKAKVAMWAYDRIIDSQKSDKDALSDLFKNMPNNANATAE
jgi:hypothetical protein